MRMYPMRESSSPVSAPLAPSAGGLAVRLLARVANFYAKTLAVEPAALECLQTLRLDDPAMIETFSVGYCNGSLCALLAHDGEVPEQLRALGILDERNQEILLGCVVVPICDAAGNITGFYGRRAGTAEPRDLYLLGTGSRLFNGQAARTHSQLIVAESIPDALTLWSAGFHNTIAGCESWTEESRTLLREHGVTGLYLVGNKDVRGASGEEPIASVPAESGVVALRVPWPEGVGSACDFLATRSVADFEALLRSAGPLADPSGTVQVELRPDGFAARYGSRRYEISALDKPSPSRLRATIRALAASPHDHRFVIDTFDFYAMRSKRSFIAEAARMFGEPVEAIEADVNRLTLAAEKLVAQRAGGAVPVAEVSEAERVAGAQLAHSPDLIGGIQRDLDLLGIVGERTNRLLLYLAMTSRKMEEPLAVRIVSSSGAGKSHLQAAVLSLCPAEDLIELTSLTDRALFYKSEDSLRHKAIAIAEVAGAEGARYALRNLISDHRLVIESTARNMLTGRMESQINTVHGPTAVFETTTNPETDAETKSRYLLLSVDESPEQTQAILEAQRHSHTLDGRRQRLRRGAVLARQHAFQRMLRPLAVVNPFEPLLAYGRTAMHGALPLRRDHPKYLNLILAITFLHQHQRAVKTDEELGEYIETTLEDIAVANKLATELFGQSLDELSFPGRELLRLLGPYVTQRARAEGKKQTREVEWTRRELREAIQWTEARLRLHLAELVRLEYIAALAGRFGSRFRYQLLIEPGQIAGVAQRNIALKAVGQLDPVANLAVSSPHLAGTSQAPSCEVAPPAGEVEGHREVGVAGELSPYEHKPNHQHEPNLAGSGGKHIDMARTNNAPMHAVAPASK